MYKFRLANNDDLKEILEIKKFDLDIRKKPRFFVMKNEDKLIAFTLVTNDGQSNFLEYLDIDKLNYDEIDFFFRSLIYLIGRHMKTYSRRTIDGFTKKADKDGYYLVYVPLEGRCKIDL